MLKNRVSFSISLTLLLVIFTFFAGKLPTSSVIACQTPKPTATATATDTPKPSTCPTATGTAKPTSSATATATSTSSPTSTPSGNPTPTSTPNNGDVCPNIDGIQTSLPDGTHFGLLGDCISFSNPGVPDSGMGGGDILGASTGKILGTSTMAATGTVQDALFNSIFTLGSLLTSFGIMKNGKKKA